MAQFRPGRPEVMTRVVVRLVREGDGPVFHLLCDGRTLLKVDRTGLRKSLQALEAANPGVMFVFDYRPSGRVS